jgi:hypothetical protein
MDILCRWFCQGSTANVVKVGDFGLSWQFFSDFVFFRVSCFSTIWLHLSWAAHSPYLTSNKICQIGCSYQKLWGPTGQYSHWSKSGKNRPYLESKILPWYVLGFRSSCLSADIFCKCTSSFCLHFNVLIITPLKGAMAHFLFAFASHNFTTTRSIFSNSWNYVPLSFV